MLDPNVRRTLARIRFTIDKIPHQLIHYTLGNTVIRLAILKLLSPFPRLKVFLRENVARVQQGFVKKRILYQRSIHPTMVMQSRRQAAPIRPESLSQVNQEPRTVQDIVRRIEIELE